MRQFIYSKDRPQETFSDPPNSRSNTFILQLEDDAYHKIREGLASTNIPEDQFEIKKYGETGELVEPDTEDLMSEFQTDDKRTITHMMFSSGYLKGAENEDAI